MGLQEAGGLEEACAALIVAACSFFRAPRLQEALLSLGGFYVKTGQARRQLPLLHLNLRCLEIPQFIWCGCCVCVCFFVFSFFCGSNVGHIQYSLA